MDEHFSFIPPPECPVFRPTKEEFRDPLEYIDQIKPIAIKSGICKIIPPDDWRPPFSVNVNTFQFTPRVQKLYELEAQSRVKLNFMTKLSQLVRLQGNDKLKIPNMNGQHVDLYKLHKMVNEAGGYEHVTANKLWPKIGNKLGYKTASQVNTLRINYERIVLPYDIMVAGASETLNCDSRTSVKPKPVLHPSTTKKRKSVDPVPIDPRMLELNPELKRLQFFGAGPRMVNGPKLETKLEEDLQSGPLKRKCLSDYVCKVCGSGDQEDRLLICDNDACQDSFHCECLVPPIIQIPKQSWKCQNCVLNVLNKAPVEYGFPSSSTTYTLYDFGRSADRFKANYFGKDLHEVVPCSTVEKEFWRILQSFNDDVIVEYGADIHSSHQGSGFPTEENIKNGKCTLNNGETNMDLAVKYSTESWNLNNLPLNKRSILSYIRGNIDGMKVPWCYVGMVFSSFCWHIEDHWSFSINYLHWGEPKTWYGVSSENAVQFETAMKKQAPELFENHEDLLHHITTTMNPNILQREGVPIYRTDQHAGQFVVTFPRAYHTGFNQGFNFAEAVNFCPGNWLPMGRECISHYARLRRHCVFSHEELLCTIAEAALLEQDNISDNEVSSKYPLIAQLDLDRSQISIDTNIRRIVHSELEIVLDEETKYRSTVKKLGITKSDRRLFENMGDDERACCLCQTTCFMSAVECLCLTDSKCENLEEDGEICDQKRRRLVCFRHIDNICPLCPMSQCTFLYRFDCAEIKSLLSGLEVRLQDFHTWETNIKAYFTEGPIEEARRHSLDQLQVMLNEGAECGFETCEEFVKARGLLNRGLNLISVCKHWLKALQETDDCSKIADNNDTIVPKSVLVDCVHTDGTVEIKNINVSNLSEENLAHMSQTLSRFPVHLPCSQFEQMVSRLLQWREDSRQLMESGVTNAAQQLPKVVQLFEEAKRLFPGWTAFANERTCLMLIGKSLQWLVRIRECEDAVKAGKSAHLEQGDRAYSLPISLVRHDTLLDLVSHGDTLLVSLKETATDLGDTGQRYLVSVTASVDLAMTALSDVMSEINRIKDESLALPKRTLTTQVLNSLKRVTEHCLCTGVRVKEVDEARMRIYKSCVDAILCTGKPGRSLALEFATQVLQIGSALFSEGVLDRDAEALTQRHLAAKAQLAIVSRAVRQLKAAYTGCCGDHGVDVACKAGCGDVDFLKILMPRHYSGDADSNRECLAYNASQFMQTWLTTSPSENQIISLMSTYQSMIVAELSSLDLVISCPPDGAHDCSVCGSEPPSPASYCPLCAPRSKRPSISDMAQLNKLLKQSASIVSVHGVALQALSKRTVTWLESLVTVVRLNLKYLARFYPDLRARNPSVPVCIKELFTQARPSPTPKTANGAVAKELLSNLCYLKRVGHSLEVNVGAYLAVISGLIAAVQQDLRQGDPPLVV